MGQIKNIKLLIVTDIKWSYKHISTNKMVSGTLYTYPGNYRAQKIQIAAAYSGADVKVDPNFEFGQTNASEDFLKKFPLGKVPAFEDSTGVCLSESNATAYYVSNDTLRG